MVSLLRVRSGVVVAQEKNQVVVLQPSRSHSTRYTQRRGRASSSTLR